MIESVRLHQMRSWADGTVALTPGAHIFWGENGAGKTTILEACIIAATAPAPLDGLDDSRMDAWMQRLQQVSE